jgi:hypothetical protein
LDRLGRNYEDVCDTIRQFMRRGVVIRTVINNFTFDGSTKDPIQQAVRDALVAFMAATARHRPRRPRPPRGVPWVSRGSPRRPGWRGRRSTAFKTIRRPPRPPWPPGGCDAPAHYGSPMRPVAHSAFATALSLSRYHRPPVTTTINPSSPYARPVVNSSSEPPEVAQRSRVLLWKRAPSKSLQFLC